MDHPHTDLSKVRRPIAAAHGLPNRHYTDPAIFDEEKRALFFDNWAGIGVAADVAEIGDAVPVTFLGVPLLMIRDRTGRLRVFQNTCRHRGMILVDAPRRIEGAIRCPYHSWCYATDGRLVSTPHIGGPGHNTHADIDRALLGLVEVPSAVWLGVVFVNISATAPPFAEAHADLIDRWAEFDQPMYHGGEDSRFALELACNWKLAVENYAESYHLPWVHPGLNSYSRLEDHYHIEAEGRFSGQGTRVYRQLKDENGACFPDFAGLSGKWETAAEYVTLLPNVMFGVHRDHAFAILLIPVAPDRTIEQVHLFYARPDVDPALRSRNAEQWRQVFEEDIFVVEGMQRGRHAPLFDGGRFSPAMDGPTHLFHVWVAGQMDAARRQTAAE